MLAILLADEIHAPYKRSVSLWAPLFLILSFVFAHIYIKFVLKYLVNNMRTEPFHPSRLKGCPLCRNNFDNPEIVEVPDDLKILSYQCPLCHHCIVTWPKN